MCKDINNKSIYIYVKIKKNEENSINIKKIYFYLLVELK